jgi:hypothetical protein
VPRGQLGGAPPDPGMRGGGGADEVVAVGSAPPSQRAEGHVADGRSGAPGEVTGRSHVALVAGERRSPAIVVGIGHARSVADRAVGVRSWAVGTTSLGRITHYLLYNRSSRTG